MAGKFWVIVGLVAAAVLAGIFFMVHANPNPNFDYLAAAGKAGAMPMMEGTQDALGGVEVGVGNFRLDEQSMMIFPDGVKPFRVQKGDVFEVAGSRFSVWGVWEAEGRGWIAVLPASE